MKSKLKAERISYLKMRFPDEAILEYVVWKLPNASPDRPHGYKYSYYYGKAGKRLVGYDNESGKGDHKHIGENEYPYTFVDLETLAQDFMMDVQVNRNKEATNEE